MVHVPHIERSIRAVNANHNLMAGIRVEVVSVWCRNRLVIFLFPDSPVRF